jgi:hypothetical protein
LVFSNSRFPLFFFPTSAPFQMAKHKRKAIATATRGKATLHDSAPDRSIVLAVKALSSSSFPPLASAVSSSVLEPI